jgi:hypothetical protein
LPLAARLSQTHHLTAGRHRRFAAEPESGDRRTSALLDLMSCNSPFANHII